MGGDPEPTSRIHGPAEVPPIGMGFISEHRPGNQRVFWVVWVCPLELLCPGYVPWDREVHDSM